MIKEANKILSKDPILQKLLHLDIHLPYYDGDVNAYLYSSIISQQLSTKAADAIYRRFLNHFDGATPSPQNLLDTDKDTLRLLGLSNAKTKYLQNVALYFLENPDHMQNWPEKSNDKIIAELTTIKGVGVWTVQMVLMFCLARRDVFPLLDLGVRTSIISLYNVKGEKKDVLEKLLKIANKWKPYRSIASLYLWAWRNLGETK